MDCSSSPTNPVGLLRPVVDGTDSEVCHSVAIEVSNGRQRSSKLIADCNTGPTVQAVGDFDV